MQDWFIFKGRSAVSSQGQAPRVSTAKSYDDHYPRLFAPFKTTVLEMLAREVCKQERRDSAEKADNLKAE